VEKLIRFLEDHMGSCFYKKHFGIECPGCGVQRSIIHLLKGDFIESLQTFPALIPTIIMLLFLAAHLIFKFERGAKILLYLFFLNVGIMTFSYILRMFLN
jgi:hypothetical protein